MHKCLGEGCNRWITNRFAICRECEKKYGNRALKWPAWLRYLWNQTQRDRRRENRQEKHEVSLID